MNVEHKVAFNKLSNSEIYTFIRNSHPVKQDMSSFYRDVRQLVDMSIERLVDSVDSTQFDSQDPWRIQYWNWAQHHLERGRGTPHREEHNSPPSKPGPTIEELSEKVASVSRVGRLYAEVASNLLAIFNGETHPLELLLKSGLLKDGYAEWTELDCAKQAAAYVDLLAHQVPGLNILEVGGGTAATTRNFIRALRSGTDDSVRSLRCNRYDFTDISAAFLEKAQEEFAVYHSQMTYATLNTERDFAEQGFSEGFYDIVAADNVLHVTTDLGKTLRNVRKALKTGGKLIMHELIRPAGWTAGFIFGVFPGWWLGVDDGRTLSPNLEPRGWDNILKANGFSGVDIVFRDFDDDVAHQVGWMVATATEVEPASSLTVQLPAKHEAIIVINNASEHQQSLSHDLGSPLQELTGSKPRILDLATATAETTIDENVLVILLIDCGPSFVATLDGTAWDCMSLLVQKSRRLLWVSAGGGHGASPDHGMLDGLTRTLRSENNELHLVTVSLDFAEAKSPKATHLMKIAREMLSRAAHQNYEQEYTEIDGFLHTRRLNEANQLKSALDARVIPYQVSPMPLDGKIRFKLSPTSSPESDDPPHYIRLPESSRETPTDHTVEILARAVSVQSRGYSITPEQEEYPAYGNYCSGIVLSGGLHSGFVSGDYVLAIQDSPLRSHLQVPSQCVVKLPADLSFTDACSVIPPVVTAYHAMVEVGDVKPGHFVLIHDGASLVGQAALRLLASRGVRNVWATAANEEANVCIAENQSLPSERILPKAWFDGHSMLSYQWKRKFDIILTQTTDSVSSLLYYAKSGGRAIVIDPSTTESKDVRPMQSTPENICVSTIPVGMGTPEALIYAINVPTPVLMSPKNDAVISRALDLVSIVSRLQHSKEAKMTIVEFNDNDIADVRNYGQSEHSVNPRGTYVIAGGFGGLGRAVARWLVDHGARYLILLSRSGPRTTEALELLSELADKGVHAEAPCCDISNRVLLKSVLSNCAESMPPIMGCVQSTMVMTESIFPKMQFQDWKKAVNPKVQGSWNLHAELPKGLDFFILFSSIMGILGTSSLAGYNAGNTYEDALARYRVSQGERAIAIDLGGIPDAGYFIDHAEKLKTIRRTEKHVFVYVKEVCALLDIFCNPENPLASSLTNPQTIVGVRPPAHWKHIDEVPFTMSQPYWGHMHHVAPLSDLNEDSGGALTSKREQALDIAERLSAAESLVAAAEIVRVALTRRVSVLLGTPEDRLDEQKPMHSFGIDSLSAIDIRNWVGKVFNVDIPVFDILGGATFGSASRAIAYKAQLKL
ncbi:KR-domain-containing protein [Amniculicola lignicola CBS 123094]|uniref:KR-domain-containing protein n=1 Tax=Amniculicola lignicola CBS 123094 TaxID=1392246 RepID=A0A6A5WXU0_9PLEO|nr:KR-domain-containing protein [Amniculicola lignicola CBS 123094]